MPTPARSGVRPDRQRAVCVAVLQEAGSLKRKVHALAGLELPVPSHLDIGEMGEAAARSLIDQLAGLASARSTDTIIIKSDLIIRESSLRRKT